MIIAANESNLAHIRWDTCNTFNRPFDFGCDYHTPACFRAHCVVSVDRSFRLELSLRFHIGQAPGST